jgi:hypothetical protein
MSTVVMPRPTTLRRLLLPSRPTRIVAGALALGGALAVLASSALPSAAETPPALVAPSGSTSPSATPGASSTPSPDARAGTTADPTAQGPHRVATADYDLGATALRVPGFHNPAGQPAGIEVAAVVHYPTDLGAGPYPLVLVQHGFRETCADRAAGAAWQRAYQEHLTATNRGRDGSRWGRAMDAARADLLRWPCAPGVAGLPSFRGFDDLGTHLAGYGFVVVSMSANGISAGVAGSASDTARAALVGRHLELWRQLSETGTGPLADGLPDAAEFRGRVDLTRVAGIGHAEGARAMLPGNGLTAVVALSPAEPQSDSPPGAAPLLVLTGTCDSVGVAGATATTSTGGRLSVTVDGANRNFTNTQWSPAGGQVLAHDDVDRDLQLSADIRPRSGWCRHAQDDGVARQLTEVQQRDVVAAYVTAFLTARLGDDHRFDDVLTGVRLPFRTLTTVTVQAGR